MSPSPQLKKSLNKKILSRRILSPCHCEEATAVRLALELDKALELDFNEIHIGGPMHEEEAGNLDGVIEYEGTLARANSRRRMHRVRHRREILNNFCEKARAHGVKTYLWHHELWFPDAITKTFSNKFNAGGGIDPVGKFASDYLASRYATARRQLPLLDGLVLTLAETSQVVYQANAPEAEVIEQTASFLKLLDRSLRKAGWDYVLRLFCWEEKEYRIMSEAIARLQVKPVMMLKAVPFDWHLHFPVDRVIEKFRDMPLIVEVGTNNEYWGVNRVPCANPDYYIDQLRQVRKLAPNLLGVAARTDRDHAHVWDGPNEINLHAVSAVAHGISTTGHKIAANFARQRYGISSVNAFAKLLLGTGEVTTQGYYERGRFLNGSYPGHLLGVYNQFQQARDLFFEPGNTDYRQARRDVETKAAALRRDFATMAKEFTPEDRFALQDMLQLLEGVVKFNSLTCDLLYGLRCAIYDRAWRSSAKWEVWKKQTLELADSLERKFGSDLFANGIFAQGNAYPGSTSDRLRLQVQQLPIVLKGLEFRRRGGELLKKKNIPYYGKKCFELPSTGMSFATKAGRHPLVLVMVAGSEMAITRSLRFRWNNGEDSIKPLGTFGWFKCCNGYRTYEIEVPASAIQKGHVEIELASANTNYPVRLASVRFEERLSGKRGELLDPPPQKENFSHFFRWITKNTPFASRKNKTSKQRRNKAK